MCLSVYKHRFIFLEILLLNRGYMEFFCFFLKNSFTVPCDMWDLSSPTMDRTLASHTESVESLTAGPLGKSLYGNFKNRFIEMKFMCHVVHTFKVQNLIVFSIFAGEGNGNPLHYSRLENPMGGGAW